jgi:hypothetical protein
MAAVDFRGAYELLRRVMEQQELDRQQAGYGSTPGGAPATDSGGYGTPRGGLLGRLRALQEEQGRYQPYHGDVRQSHPEPKDPNFRKLSRVDVRPQDAIASSGDQSGSFDYSGGRAAFDVPSRTSQGAGMFGIPGYMPTSPWGIPVARGVPFPGMRGRPFPPPPLGSGSMPRYECRLFQIRGRARPQSCN